MSLYASYLKERTSDNIVELPEGFATYRLLNTNQCYIIDIYVLPEYRKSGIASHLADTIVAMAKTQGCTELLGTVVPSTNSSTTSLKVLLAYGMSLHSADSNLIVCKKDI